jgi:hypothetical protein
MPKIEGFSILKQEGSLSCWAAATKSVLDYFAKKEGRKQNELVTWYGLAEGAGDAEQVLEAAGALRRVERLRGDELAIKRAPILLLLISDSIDRNEPVLVLLDMAGGVDIGHVVVVYGYDMHNQHVYMKDPARPDVDIVTTMVDLVRNFAPYTDKPEYKVIRYYAKKLMFTKKPPFSGLWWKPYQFVLRNT